MKKKAFFVLVFAALVTGGAFAQNIYLYAPPVGGNIFVNVGVGVGFVRLGYTVGLPPINANVEFVLPIRQTISVGPYFGFTTYGASYSYADFTGFMLAFGARGSLHFNFTIPNLDVYAGLNLGLMIDNLKRVTNGGGTAWDAEWDYSRFDWGVHTGARYFFTPAVGVYLEAGYSGLNVVQLGLALKF